MCRWLAYSGSPMLLDELLYKTEHSLIVQSLHSRLGAEETNGDGFGIGWYGEYETPALFKSVEPAWDDENLRDLALHIRSGNRYWSRSVEAAPNGSPDSPPLAGRPKRSTPA